MYNYQLSLACCVLLALGSGCSKPAQQKIDEPPMTPAAAPLDESRILQVPERVDVYIDRRILELCYLPLPHFSFDSSSISDQARNALDSLAECFVSGPAAGKRLKLVGHADPRGTEEYNLALGQRRAASVAEYLGEKGLAEERMETSSRGELDATGTDETSYADDRRVGIFLAD